MYDNSGIGLMLSLPEDKDRYSGYCLVRHNAMYERGDFCLAQQEVMYGNKHKNILQNNQHSIQPNTQLDSSRINSGGAWWNNC